MLEHVKQLIAGEIIWAPGIRGAVVASRRGGDFELVVGRDLSIGYESHSPLTVRLYIEESLYRGLGFAVFEPNDEPLWAQIRLAAGSFMNGLFRQGAFKGAKASDARGGSASTIALTISAGDRSAPPAG